MPVGGERRSIGVTYWGYIIPIMENQMEKNMENEMETGIIFQVAGRDEGHHSPISVSHM